VLIRPDRYDLRVIGFYVGKILVGVGALMVVPLVVALWLGEFNDATALALGGALSLGVGRFTEWRLHTRESLDWSHGLVTVALAWLLAPALVAVPLYLSGHFATWIDAYFDGMSGLTTSGLSLIQDLDHLSVPMNLLRHITHFAGGQGIVVVVLTVLASSSAHIATLYAGEGRDDRIVPNIVRTARFIYLVAVAFMIVGTTALFIAGLVAGLSPGRSLFHAVNLFMAAFDTGGFAPYSTSIAYYHSVTMELVVMVLMVAGSLSFALHYELWRGRRREVFENLETRSLLATGFITTVLVVFGLARAGTFSDVDALFRKGVFTLVSAHTGTGFAVSPSRLFVTDWGLIAPAAVVIAMALGGMASSTAGGIKAIRIGLAAKAVFRDIRRAVQPDAAVVVASYRSRTRRIIRDEQVRSAITIFVLFLLLYFGGAMVAVFYGYSIDEALFESTSAAANVGLSSGLLSPMTTPMPLKIVFTLQMWVGRLEFMAVFALIGYGVSMVRGRT
jgi:trk system potassium uptake protein TrkH